MNGNVEDNFQFTVKIIYSNENELGHLCIGCKEYVVRKPRNGAPPHIQFFGLSNGEAVLEKLLPGVPDSDIVCIYVMNRFGKTVDVINERTLR